MIKKRENPLLQYHLFGFTVNRWKRQPVLYGAVAVGMGLTYLLLFQMFHTYEASLGATLNLSLFVMCLTAPLMAYNSFSLEYEKGTWESLALTRLTAGEILWGKWGAALARVALLTLLLTPMLFIATDFRIELDGPLLGRFTTVVEPSYEFYKFAASVALLFSWGALLVSLGVWLSFKLKRTISTASTLYAGQLLALVLLPVLLATFGIDSSHALEDELRSVYSFKDGFFWWLRVAFSSGVIFCLNPFYTTATLDSIASRVYYLYKSVDTMQYFYVGWGFAQSFVYVSWGIFFAGLAYRGVKTNWRK
ncbi:MAG: hypothetical protein ACK4ME_01805 [Fimbriimonadales bacterium]